MALTDYYVTDAGAGDNSGSSIANAMPFSRFVDYMSTGGSYTAAAGDRFNIIGTITSRGTTTDTFSNGGTSTSPVIIRGWKSDNTSPYAGRTNGNGSLITTDYPTITYSTGRMNITGNWIIVQMLVITSATTNPALTINSNSSVFACSVTCSGTGGFATTLSAGTGTNCVIDNCDAFQTGASGAPWAIQAYGGGSRVSGCRVKSTSGGGINIRSQTVVTRNTIFECGTVGISMNATDGTPHIAYNTIYGCAGDGIDIITGSTGLQHIVGNMITDNGGYGVDFNSAAVAGFVAYNRTRDNTSGAYNLATDWVAATSFFDVTTDTGGASTDYVSAGSGDFNLIAGSPATSASLPQYASMGALQRSQTGGGSGVVGRLVNSNNLVG